MKILTSAILIFTILLLTAYGCKEKLKLKMNIHQAAVEGNLEVIQEHIKGGSDLNAKDKFGSTPLLIAATFDKRDIAEALINAGVDLNTTNSEGSTPLITAAFFGRIEIVRFLVEKGAEKNIRNKNGVTAFESVSGSFEHVKPHYDTLVKALGPLGLQLDYEYLQMIRPRIAELLR